MPKSKAEQVAENRQRIREQLQNEPDNEKLQREVMEPEGVEVPIGGSPVRLYPLPGKSVRNLMALSALVFAGSTGKGDASTRIGATLVKDYFDDFIPLLAEATQPAGQSDSKHLAKIQDDLDKKTRNARGAGELAAAFYVMMAQNDVMEAFSPNEEAPAGA